MAIRGSREIVIDAPPETILDALADIPTAPSWSSVHRRAEIVDRYPDGRPHHVNVTIKLLGLVDQEVLEYHWGPDWVCWDAAKTFHQHGQHAEYSLRPEGLDKTRVCFSITLEPSAPLPAFLVERGRQKVLKSATEGLRRRVMAALAAERMGS